MDTKAMAFKDHKGFCPEHNDEREIVVIYREEYPIVTKSFSCEDYATCKYFALHDNCPIFASAPNTP